MDHDHDILIEMRTILKGVVEDFRAYRKSNQDELDKIRLTIHELTQQKVGLTEYARDIFETREALKNTEIRFQKIERLMYIAVGVLGAAQFIAPFIINKFF